MHFNVYIDDQTGHQLKTVAAQSGESRNALIRKAVQEWLARQHKPQWPEEVMAFDGIADTPEFERDRAKLRAPAIDPLA